VAGKQIHADVNCDDEVPSSFPIVRLSNTLDFEEDDDGNEIYEDADASSDDEDVRWLSSRKSHRLEAKGRRRRQQAREARR
jgi:hypothetical protein